MTTAEDHQTIGVIGALAINGPTGEILPHECTLPKARSDRLALLRATRMNLDPIWGLFLTDGQQRNQSRSKHRLSTSAYRRSGTRIRGGL